jgi:hypothetical protein
MRTCDNYEVKIWIGLREEYTDTFFSESDAVEIIKRWCNERKQCVSITPTRFVYVDGQEPGLIIGFINYPRFPMNKEDILARAIELGESLRKHFKQFRVSVTTPTTSYLLEDEPK